MVEKTDESFSSMRMSRSFATILMSMRRVSLQQEFREKVI